MRTQYDLMSAMHYGESLQDYTGKTGEEARTLHAAIHQLSTALGIDSEGKDDEDLLKHSKEVFDALGKERQIEMLRELSEREVELQRKVREHLVAADLSDPDVFDYGDPAHYGKRPYGPFLQEAPPSRGTPGSRGIYGNYTPLKTYSGKEKQLIGKVLDLDMSLVKANKNGIALVVVATGKRRPGVPGEVMAVDVSTGEVLDSFSFTGGGAGPSSERHTNGITPGLSGELDFEEHADLQAQWGLNGLKYGGAGHWKDGDGVRWHVLTKDPMAKRAGMWIHPTKGNTYGCLGMQPGEAKRFRRFWEDQDGFPQMTFITQNVWER
ncbi:MAG: hypothetical protein MRY32_01675, partial [Rickettsiales bacterium]|nr:hypothetical protein [Rickettsiales bacterium]